LNASALLIISEANKLETGSFRSSAKTKLGITNSSTYLHFIHDIKPNVSGENLGKPNKFP